MRLAFDAAGPAGGDAVVFMHGFTDTRRSWAGTASALAALRPDLRIYNLDLRGHGASPSPLIDPRAPERAFVVADLAADVLAFMDAHGVERATLCGHSLGSFVAQELAIAAPRRVRGVVLACSAARTADNPVIRDAVLGAIVEGRWRPMIEAVGLRWPDDALALTPREVDPHAERFLAEQWVTEPGAPPELLSAIVRDTARIPLGTWLGVGRGVLRWDHRERLRDLAVPALIIAADDDAVCPAADQAELRALVRFAVWRELPGGHNLPWSAAERIARELATFLTPAAAARRAQAPAAAAAE
jgi:pimeloyl-ACP methyl ester carboxylesterase